MKKKNGTKRYWEMNSKELAEATKEFDQEFVIEKSTPLTPAMRARWEKAKRKSAKSRNGRGIRVISIRVDESLLKRSEALARKMGISHDLLVARGLRKVLAATEQ
jgi:hypothetical protein